jgi:sulfatase modifying factor 1
MKPILARICISTAILLLQSPASDGKAQASPGQETGMIRIPKGTFHMGCKDCRTTDTLPVHLVSIDSFWIDETPVTNTAYARFAKASSYQTIAERSPLSKDFPDADPEQLVPGSIVFSPTSSNSSLLNPYAWWKYIRGANWQHPEGPGSQSKADHPAVHIAWEDAKAYCQWQGKELPTEAEFEYAARGGLDGKRYTWGDELKPGGRWKANIWQGKFPTENKGEDGYKRTSPVKAFPPNGYGLYDMSGNIWQWCSDWYRPDSYVLAAKTKKPIKNPRGPADSFDEQEPGIAKRVQKGGSFLCSDEYCTRYLVGSRGKGAVDSSSSNVGFRCIRRVQSP